MQNEIFLTQKFALEKDESGAFKNKIKGIAYSGSIIEEHGPFKNLIIDLKTLSVAKSKTPILRDHIPSQVAGHSALTIDDSVKFDGVLSRKTEFGVEILDLADEGFEWEMSLGVYGGELEEIEDEEVNGLQIDKGFALRNGMIREISVVALGADKNTSAQVFNVKKGEPKMIQFTQEQWNELLLGCGCGGSSKEDLSKTFATAKEDADKLRAEIEAKQAELDALKAELDKIKDEKEFTAREEEIKLAVEEKGIEFSVEKIKAAAKSKEQTEMLLSIVKEMKSSKISKEMTKQVDLGGSKAVAKDDAKAIRLAAEQLVKSGDAVDFLDAITKVEVK